VEQLRILRFGLVACLNSEIFASFERVPHPYVSMAVLWTVVVLFEQQERSLAAAGPVFGSAVASHCAACVGDQSRDMRGEHFFSRDSCECECFALHVDSQQHFTSNEFYC
jgi:hypothetical protein